MSGNRSSSSSRSWSGIFGQGILSRRIKSTKALFLIRLVFFFAFFYLLWYFLSPFYNHILAGVSEQELKLSEVGKRKITQSVIAEKKEIWVYHIPEGSPVVGLKANILHFDMVLLFALIWAVPHVPFKRRMKIFLLGFLIVFVIHLLKVFVFVKKEYSLNIKVDGVPYWSIFQQRAYEYLDRFILFIVNQIFPVLIWSLLYWHDWWDKRFRLLKR